MSDSHALIGEMADEIMRLKRELDEAWEQARLACRIKDEALIARADAEAANAVMGDALEAFTPVNRPTLCGGCGCVYFTCSFCGQLVAISKSAHSAKADCSGHQVVDHTAKCPVRLRREALASRTPAAARYQEIVQAAEAGAKACQESFKAPPEDQPCCGMCIWRATCEAVRAKETT